MSKHAAVLLILAMGLVVERDTPSGGWILSAIRPSNPVALLPESPTDDPEFLESVPSAGDLDHDGLRDLHLGTSI